MSQKGKKIWKIIGSIVLAIVIILGAFLAYLTIQEYRPDPIETQKIPENTDKVSIEDEFSIVTYNVGYGGLSQETDFFMDGGTEVQPESEEVVQRNLDGIAKILNENVADAYFIQEVDLDSKRSYHINEKEFLEQETGKRGIFAYNFKSQIVPYPLPMIGHVESGLLTLLNNKVDESMRVSLPESFTWPVKTCNLKRCLMKTYLPIEGSDKKLVLINFHLEAYDSGEGKIKQSKMLAEILEEEYEKGNYVIAGGDFNQTFPSVDKYPFLGEGNWKPGVIDSEMLPEGFHFAIDDRYPTCRLLNEPYTGSYDTSQVYVLDGFIVSPNVSVSSVNVINTDFEFTDHQPVKVTFEFNQD